MCNLTTEHDNRPTEQIVHAIPNVLWHAKADTEGVLYDTYISETSDILLELAPGTIGNDWNIYFSYVHPEDLTGVMQVMQNAIQNLGEFGVEYRLLLTSGKIKTVYSNGNIRMSADKMYREGFGVTTDISFIKKKEKESAKSEQKFKALLNIMPYPVLVHRENQILFLNSATMEFAGVQAEHEVKTTDIIQFVHPEDKARVTERMAKAMSEEEPVSLDEERFVTTDGNVKFVEVRGLPFIDTDGEKSLLVAFSDISEQKKAKKALEESEQRYRALFELAPFPIIVNCEHQITLANNAAKAYIGIKDDELLKTKAVEDFIHPNSIQAVKDKIRKILENGKTANILDQQFVSSNGKIFDMDIAASPVIYNNKPAVIVVMNDISDKKKDKKRLEELVATKDRFFSIIAHDLKNPFHQILGFGEILTADEDYDLFQTRKIVQYMYASAKKGYALLENLLEWSRSQTGRIKYTPTNLALFDLVQTEIDFIALTAFNKNIKITNQTEKSQIVFADKDMLRTVLRNLLSNAVKFTFRSGSIKLTSKSIDGKTYLKVSDTGIGITPDKLTKIFRIDETESMPGTESETGTGLGLILCKEFCEKNGGDLIVESAVGKGSEFTVILPEGQD